MRESVKILHEGMLAKLAVLTLALAVIFSLGANPLLMQRHMANAAPTHGALATTMPTMAHNAAQAASGGFCVQMAPCTAVISQQPELHAIGVRATRLVISALPRVNGRALPPPFHPPIV